MFLISSLEEINKFICSENYGEYINLLDNQGFWSSERQKRFPQFATAFDITTFILDELRKMILLETYQSRYDKCSLLMNECEKIIFEADQADKLNKTETVSELLNNKNYRQLVLLYNNYSTLIDSYKEKCIKNSNEFIKDVDEIIKDFKSSSDVYLLKTKRKMLWDIQNLFNQFRVDYLNDDTIVDNKYIGKNSFK